MGEFCVSITEGPGGGDCDNIAKKFNSRETNDRYFRWQGKAEETVICSWEEGMPDDPSGVMGPYIDAPKKRLGCKVDVTRDMSYGDGKNQDGTTKWMSQGPGWMRSGSGSACDLTKEGLGDGSSQNGDGKEESSDKDATRGKGDKENCTRGYEGEVNGKKVCVPIAGNKDTPSEETRHDTTTTDDGTGNGKTTNTTTTTSCKGERCTTTTSSTDSDTGKTSNTTRDESRDSFCGRNPRSSLCGNNFDPSGEGRGDRDGLGGGTSGSSGGKGNGNGNGGEGSSFGGQCLAGFVCKGDAVQCAMARQQHIRACELFEAPSPERQAYDLAKTVQGNTTGDNPLNSTVNASTVIDQSDVIGGGAGMQDVSLTVAGRAITLPLSSVNPYLEMLGRVLVAVSFLLAFRIVARG